MSRRESSGYGRSQSRREQLKDEFGDDAMEEVGDRMMRVEAEQLYMHYAGNDDLTQAEAEERSNTVTEMSQSTVSRLIRDMEDGILTEPVKLLDCYMSERTVRDLEAVSPEYVREYRRAWVRAMLNIQALDMFHDPQSPTPQWAQDRFPDMDPDIGRRYGERSRLFTSDQIHD
jgi:hypothetical protein